ncbi:helix-turn-helix domain-containing protein [Fusobacterium varium]|uniref:helix-turn-helix domain-containing protein n=1 Tax=Fusobacterium varium TaxID=856 RepID=UPI001F1C23B6|nr:helix-turn-helix transcriptional regulator [Fusobacterium varium]MCF2672271.1 helix-turn-helix transcriptional regulator [Fusobacterium varium]UYI78870.1 MAG: helix-turn-helix domain-containing protein [Fusobacterium varium]
MEINEIIKKRRKELGLTLKQVAEQLGVSESLISRYESKDVKNMGIDKITPLAKVLKCTPAYLMGWENQTQKEMEDDIIEKYKLTPEELTEFEKVMSINSALMFNGKEIPEENRIELEQTLKKIFIRSLLIKRSKESDENGKKNS